MPPIDLSVILPVYNEQDSLEPLIKEIETVLESAGRSFEIIVVDDGSTDHSVEVVLKLARARSSLRLICFRRNFGQAAAFDAGFRAAASPIVVTLDADGQNNPADIPRLVDHLNQNGLDFVCGRRALRKDAWLLRKLPSRIANWIIRCVTGTRIHDLGCSLKVYRAAVAKEIRLYGEMHRFIPVLMESAGARVAELDVDHRPRTAGKSKYGLSRTFKVLLDLITVWFMRGFQTSPIYLFGGVALALMAGALGLSAWVLFEKWFHDVFVHRNPLFILSMVMAIMAVQILAMGLLAELLIRTYFEARGRTAYVVSAEIGFGPPSITPTIFATKKESAARMVR